MKVEYYQFTGRKVMCDDQETAAQVWNCVLNNEPCVLYIDAEFNNGNNNFPMRSYAIFAVDYRSTSNTLYFYTPNYLSFDNYGNATARYLTIGYSKDGDTIYKERI